MNEVAYQLFDGAAGSGMIPPERLLQVEAGQQEYIPPPPSQQQIQEELQPIGQPYYPPPIEEVDQNMQQRSKMEKYYQDQTFYNDILSTLHGFEKGKINGATDIGVSDAMASFGFNSFLFLFLMIVYEFVYRLMPSVYASRKLHVSDDKNVIDIPRSILPFSWVPTVVGTSWSTVQKCGGLDAYFFLRFIQMSFRITFVGGVWGMIVLWPVFATGDGGASGWYYFSMANVTNRSWRLWFPTGFMILLTIYILFVMNEEFRHYLELRMEYLAGGLCDDLDPQAQHSLMVEELPKELRSDKALYSYFDKLFPGEVCSASVVLNVPDIEKFSGKKKRTVRRLEKSMAYHEATGTRGEHIVGRKRCRLFGIETFPLRSFGGKIVEEDERKSAQKGERVDSIAYYRNMLDHLNDKVEHMQKEANDVLEEGNNLLKATEWIASVITKTTDVAASSLSRNTNEEDLFGFRKTGSCKAFFSQIFFDFLFGGFAFMNRNIHSVVDTMSGSRVSSTGFVTFKTLASATTAASLPLSNDPDVLITTFAPDPRDIIWHNAHVNYSYSKGREITANICTFLGAVLWSTVIASIQTWANVDHLVKIPGLAWMESVDGGNLKTFVNGYLPVVALLTIIGILPKLFESIAMKFERRKTKTDVEKSIIGRYYYYQLANIYITVTAGSIWTALSTILDHPGAVFEILGRSLPTMVGFFVTLLMTKTLGGLPMVILRIPALLRRVFVRVIFRQKFLTQREIDEVYKKEALETGKEYPNQLLVLIICFTYACISPIILPIGSIYFLAALIVYKKQVLLIYAPDYEGGGAQFPSVCHRALIGLIMSQITLIGYTILRNGLYQPLFLVPLPFFTYYMMQTFDRIYSRPSSVLCLDRASQLDQNSMVKIHFNDNLYRQPALTEKRQEPLPYRMGSSPRSHRTSLGLFSDDINVGKIV